jgi:hypothetical protein
MCTEEGRLRTIGVALSFKVRNSRSWSTLEPADFRNGVRLVYHEGNIGTTSNVGVPTFMSFTNFRRRLCHPSRAVRAISASFSARRHQSRSKCLEQGFDESSGDGKSQVQESPSRWPARAAVPQITSVPTYRCVGADVICRESRKILQNAIGFWYRVNRGAAHNSM